MKNKRARVNVAVAGAEQGRPPWIRASIFAAIGLVVGVAWPTLAGIRIGPDLPGAKRDTSSAPPVAAAATQSAAPSAAASAAADAPDAVSSKQLVAVEGGRISRCYHGKEKLAGERCGKLRIDKVLGPRLRALASCPSALGLKGQLEVAFDLDFREKEIRVIRGRGSKLPSSTVNGIVRCIADYLHDVSPEKIAHKHRKYRVEYTLKFYPPGSAPPRHGAEAPGADEGAAERATATVTWDTALVRDEPHTGKVIARLVRGTRVKLLGRRREWYRVRVASKDGWVYRGALGL